MALSSAIVSIDPSQSIPTVPLWLSTAIRNLKVDYPDDNCEEVICKGDTGASEWRIKCSDCPGKIYVTGPGETLGMKFI
ncbi:hypothetical protein JAAARDRAFT_33408 [Jaapia argillacea MUCL 33604]|uniref:Uncharacterized protein n=1 Tax=Jaapia argillacea MUCL 33604 TaxID=933084 RepID=A0A067PYM6_9AGAM|nr:hypothetical protein JAAARDRAFT_33408 [Jaapia argillacea MUCL 33604]